MTICKIVIADDHILFRQGIKKLLEGIPYLEVIGEVNDGRELLQILKEKKSDLVLLDVTMPNMGGIDAIREVKALKKKIKILILTMHKRKSYMYQAIASGANGYLLKEDSDVELVTAIETVSRGGTYITNSLKLDYQNDMQRILKLNSKFDLKPLSKREIDILKHIAEGLSNKEIADKLDISIRTVENHRANISKKTGLRKTAEFVLYAIQNRYYELEY